MFDVVLRVERHLLQTFVRFPSFNTISSLHAKQTCPSQVLFIVPQFRHTSLNRHLSHLVGGCTLLCASASPVSYFLLQTVKV